MTVMTMITVIDLPLTEATEMGCESEKSQQFHFGFFISLTGEFHFGNSPKGMRQVVSDLDSPRANPSTLHFLGPMGVVKVWHC